MKVTLTLERKLVIALALMDLSSASKEAVLDHIESKKYYILSDSDLQSMTNRNELHWRNTLTFSRMNLALEGLLDDSQWNLWALKPDGKSWFMDAALSAMHATTHAILSEHALERMRHYVLETPQATILSAHQRTRMARVLIGQPEERLEALLDDADETAVKAYLGTLSYAATLELRKVLTKIRKASRTVTGTLKALYHFRCQLCGGNTKELYGVDIVEAHHIDPFVSSVNHHYTNLVILCPNHHRLVHQAKARFDPEAKTFIYKNKHVEPLKFNMHL